MDFDLPSVAFGVCLQLVVMTSSLAVQRHGLPAPLLFWKDEPILPPLIITEKLTSTTTTIVYLLPSPTKTIASSEIVSSGVPGIWKWICLSILFFLLPGIISLVRATLWTNQFAHRSHDGNAGPEDLPPRQIVPLGEALPLPEALPLQEALLLPEDGDENAPDHHEPSDTYGALSSFPASPIPVAIKAERRGSTAMTSLSAPRGSMSPSSGPTARRNINSSPPAATPSRAGSSFSSVPVQTASTQSIAAPREVLTLENIPLPENDDETELGFHDAANRFTTLSPTSVKKIKNVYEKKAEKALESPFSNFITKNATISPISPASTPQQSSSDVNDDSTWEKVCSSRRGTKSSSTPSRASTSPSSSAVFSRSSDSAQEASTQSIASVESNPTTVHETVPEMLSPHSTTPEQMARTLGFNDSMQVVHDFTAMTPFPLQNKLAMPVSGRTTSNETTTEEGSATGNRQPGTKKNKKKATPGHLRSRANRNADRAQLATQPIQKKPVFSISICECVFCIAKIQR